MMSVKNLPNWAQVGPENDKYAIVIEVDTAAAMGEWMKLLKISEPTQFDIECAYQCAKMDVQAALEGTGVDPRVSGKSHVIHMLRADAWALANFPPGQGTQAATQGRAARNLYRRIRGRIPFSAPL